MSIDSKSGYDKLVDVIDADRQKGVRLYSGEVVHQIPITKAQSRSVIFGLIGDTHLASVFTNELALADFYRVSKQEGVEHIFHAGDFFDGMFVYPGQAFYQHTKSLDEQVQYGVTNYPTQPGLITHFITGNHDEKVYQRVGVDMGKLVHRDDLDYLGAPCYARVNIGTPETPTLLDLVHLSGSVPYTQGYAQQKYIRNIPPDNRADMCAMGHTHHRNYIRCDGVDSLLVGGWQNANSFSARMGMSGEPGGWIVKIKTNKQGKIEEIEPKFLSYR
jgi:UDP-2,3-diacylglucosamine pyrophosphatase LpxH